MKLLLSILLSASLVQAAEAEVRWNSKFNDSYESQAEGARVSFSVQTPPKVEGMEKYPLLIALSGGLRVAPSEQFPFFQANPTRVRIWGFRALSTYDAMQVAESMIDKYPIDPDRVYLMGFSAGGSGAMHLASCHPDRFAAVLSLVAAGNNYPLANFKNLPVGFHHGDRDWTSSICNARVQAQRMQALGCPVILQEYPGAGHSVPGSHEPLMTWLFNQKRNPAPHTVTLDCEVPSLGSSYWIKIHELGDPHQRALIEAKIRDDTAIVRPKNVAGLSLDLERLPGIKSVQIGQSRLAASPKFKFQNGHWKAVESFPEVVTRPYEAGAAANLYQGEPLVIVYGTAGERTAQLQAAAQKIAKYGGPDFSTIPGKFPVVADVDLTADQQSKSNLILVGTPKENRVSQAILSHLPIKIENDILVVGERPKLPLSGQVLSMLYPHPYHPKRLVYLLAPFIDGDDKAGGALFAANAQRFLAGSDGFDRVSQADLLVQNVKHQIARQMQFDKGWKWLTFPGGNHLISARFANREHLAATYMKLMKQKSTTDFALWWGPADKGIWGTDLNDLERYNPEFYTEADSRTQRRHYETVIGLVTGAELKDIWSRWGKNRELISVPDIAVDELKDDKSYRLHIPMDLYIKLGQRHKNLGDPKAGPRIPSEEVMIEVFR